MINANSHIKDYVRIGVIDFRKDKKQLLWSYIIRLICLLFFGPLFVLIALQMDIHIPVTKKAFLGLTIPGVSPFFSILFIIIAVVFVLFLHEMIHAAVFFLKKNQKPRIGMKGLVIYAKASRYFINRNAMIINRLAPFFIITLLGFILIELLPVTALPWVFMPTLVNAAASGGDFMIIMWMMGHTRRTLYKDEGDIITAYRNANFQKLN